LVLIGQIELLPSIYGKILIPGVVRDELLHKQTPAVVKSWIVGAPEWLLTSDPEKTLPLKEGIDVGEAAAIALAMEIAADLLLIDDRPGRRSARNSSLKITGTLGVLVEGAKLGSVSLQAAIQDLQSHGFRMSEQLIKSVLDHDVS